MNNTIIDPDFFRDASCAEEIFLKAESLGLPLGEIFPDIARCSTNVHHDHRGHYFVVTTDGNFSWFDYMGNPVGNPRSLNVIYQHHIPPGLRKVVVPDGVQTIFRHAFKNCQDTLEEVVLPQSINTIWQVAFPYCSKISRIRIPRKVSFIGTDAFLGCSSLKDITAPIQTETFFRKYARENPQIKVKYFF